MSLTDTDARPAAGGDDEPGRETGPAPDPTRLGRRFGSLRRTGESSDPSVLRPALRRFAGWSLLVLVCLLIASVVVGGQIARAESLRDARLTGQSIASLLAGPLVNEAVREGDPGAAAQLEAVMRNRMKDGSLSHVKIWASDGRIIWADEKEIIGRRFPLEEDVEELFGTDRATAEVSSLDKEENVSERDEGSLIEVYAGARDVNDKPMVFEAYVSTNRLVRDQRNIILALLGLSLGALLLFQLAVLPLALSLARRIERGKEHAARLTRHALLASDLERRRIAQDLHDGVIPDLAGIGFLIPGVQSRLSAAGADPDVQDKVQRIGQIVTRDVAALRSLLTDIYPPDLEGDGLGVALDDLGRDCALAGVEVGVVIDEDLDLPLETAQLAYRVAREGLRNVVKHAKATHADVQLVREHDRLVVSVTDDGVGIQPGADERNGHLGLRLLGDTIRDLGGEVQLCGCASGARLDASFPVQLAVH